MASAALHPNPPTTSENNPLAITFLLIVDAVPFLSLVNPDLYTADYYDLR